MTASDPVRRVDRTLSILLAVTAAAIVARLVLLGARIAHWDEGRVGFDVLRYMATGAWEYRPIVHGPFLPQVNEHVFSLLGANDFTARLVVAIIGGLLPLSIWLYRDYLRDRELIVVALFFAADPILLYYSRFMRNDVLLATFAFVGLGLYVRFTDTGRTRYLYAGTASWALAFATKENVVLYPMAILGALALLLDHRLFLAREGDPPWTAVATDRFGRVGRAVRRYKLPIAVAAVEFLVIVVYFYAPRAPAGGEVGLWNAIAQPSMLPAVFEEATIGSAEKMTSLWGSGSMSEHAYLPFLEHFLAVLAGASGPLALLAVVGFVADRYSAGRPRDVVALAFYWGFVSVLGYPIVADIQAPWIVVHAVVPLAVPAAVGVSLVYDWGRSAYRERDDVGVALAGVVLVLLAAQVGVTAVSTSYVAPQAEDNVLVQYAQPEGEMRPALDAVREAAAENDDGVDVVWYGRHFVVEDESRLHRPPVAGQCEDRIGEPRVCWYNRLPLPWYLEAFDANVTSAGNATAFDRIAAGGEPPVVITRPQDEHELSDRVDGYERSAYEGRQSGVEFVFFVDEEFAG